MAWTGKDKEERNFEPDISGSLYMVRRITAMAHMRKVTLEVVPFEEVRKESAPMFELIHSYEILETIKLDSEGGICMDLIEFDLREGLKIDEVKSIAGMEIMGVIRSNGTRHTCLVRTKEGQDSKNLFKEFNLDIIYSTPTIVTPDKLTLSIIGDQQNLLKFIELVRKFAGTVEKMSFSRAAYQPQDLLSVLTEKQRDILIKAHSLGYYDMPKKIDSVSLAKKVGVSKPTLLEHLRKAEARLMAEILVGHSS
jgi:hypothetical protein